MKSDSLMESCTRYLVRSHNIPWRTITRGGIISTKRALCQQAVRDRRAGAAKDRLPDEVFLRLRGSLFFGPSFLVTRNKLTFRDNLQQLLADASPGKQPIKPVSWLLSADIPTAADQLTVSLRLMAPYIVSRSGQPLSHVRAGVRVLKVHEVERCVLFREAGCNFFIVTAQYEHLQKSPMLGAFHQTIEWGKLAMQVTGPSRRSSRTGSRIATTPWTSASALETSPTRKCRWTSQCPDMHAAH